jgi:site-specific recombinase XerD
MAAKVKFFITNPKGKTKSKKKAERVNILVRFSNGRQFDLIAKSQKEIKSDYWNNDKGIVRDIAEFEKKDDFQKDLNKLQSYIIKEYDNTPDKSKINKAWLDKTIDKFHNPDKYLQDNLTLFGFIQYFIDNSEKRVNPDTGNPVCYKMRREYQVTFDYLKKYAKKNKKEPDFIDIDLEFYQQFVDFLRNYEEKDKDGKVIKSGLAINTIGKKIQTLKIFLNAATEQGINKFMKYKSRNFKTLSEESDNIYLTKEELNRFYEFDFSNKYYLERVRDLFIVASWTGVRYSDLQQITPEKIHGDFIHFKQRKTSKKVTIPVYNVVREILQKYDGELPKPISNQKYNDYLKEAAKIAGLNSVFVKTVSVNGMKVEKKYPKYELISSHTARRSFCTNAYKDGIPTLSIMAISGHKTEKAFLKYIKIDGEEHAKKVLEMWQKNGEFMKVVK